MNKKYRQIKTAQRMSRFVESIVGSITRRSLKKNEKKKTHEKLTFQKFLIYSIVFVLNRTHLTKHI